MPSHEKHTEFPHGKCQCASGAYFGSGGCCGGTGPAAFEVKRNGTTIKVCTRCDLSSDEERKCLVTKADPVSVYFNFDPLGAFCLAGHVTDGEGEDEGYESEHEEGCSCGDPEC